MHKPTMSLDNQLVGLTLYSIHHADHGLPTVERVARAVPGLASRLVESGPQIRGAVVLSTCNRVELYLDVDGTRAAVGACVREAIAAGLPDGESVEGIELRARHSAEVLWHLFEVGAGLDSLVVGEREIAGQLKRALKAARREQTASPLLADCIEQALRTSRRVAHLTGLADSGRSVVSVGLDLLARDLAPARVALLGTGAYAGAVVSALRARGCSDIVVHSSSGRAAQFASTHDLIAADSLSDALASADLVVACRGTGTPVLTVAQVTEAMAARDGRRLDVVDLALARDAESGVDAIEGVRYLDLAVIQRHAPEASELDKARAEQLVAKGVEDLLVRLRGRQLDPAVVALRDNVATMVADEVARLPQGRMLSHDEVSHALRRLAARLIHEPSVRARRASEAGRVHEYLAALTQVYGIDAPLIDAGRLEGADPTNAEWGVVDPETLDFSVCPVVGLDLSDLDAPAPRAEAM